jgi:DNA-binding LytR/AlgR family response regulator
MIQIAICDDEKKILDEVSGYIKNYAEKKSDLDIEVFRFDSARTLISTLEDGKSFDVFVLDVYIGDEIGTTLARDIRKSGIESPIIFATTSLEHAPQGYETGTLRYLIKPLDPKKFYEALDAAILQAEKVNERMITFKTENGIEIINANHIMYSEAHEHYQYIMLNDRRQIKVRNTVTELLTTLMRNGGFVRVGSAYIVNLRNVKNVSTYKVELYNDMSIPIPRGKHIEIKKAFWDYQYEGQEE